MNGIAHMDELCRTLPYCTVDCPFGPEVVAYRIGGKIFALLSLREQSAIALKAAPELIPILLDSHPDLAPAYHLNKKHWIQLNLPTHRDADDILRLLRHSYTRVWKAMTRPLRSQFPEVEAIYQQALQEFDDL